MRIRHAQEERKLNKTGLGDGVIADETAAQATRARRRQHHHSSHWRRRTVWTIGIIVVFLIVVRLCLPFAVKDYVNRQLNHSKDFSGRISHVDIQLWRGQYRIHEITIFKKAASEAEPFFSAARLDLAIEWKELFHGAVVGQVIMHEPHLNFISGPPSEETVKSGEDESWDKMLESLFPFKINRLEISQGQIHFQNAHATPPVDIFMDHVAVTATNLSNSRDLKGELPAGIKAHATTMGSGGLDLNVHLNPVAKAPTYQVTCELTNVDLTRLNDFLKAYGKFDVDRGTFALFTSVASKDGNYEGYLKVFFENLKVFEWDKERKKDALEIFWQAIVGTVTTILKNQRTDTLATKVPVSGTYNKNSVGVWPAISTLLRNAFIRALIPKLDEPMTVQNVEKNLKDMQENKNSVAPAEKKKGDEVLQQPAAHAAQTPPRSPPTNSQPAATPPQQQ